MFDIKGGSEIVPRPEFFSAHLASFVLYFNEHYVSEEQKQVEQAKQSKALAELAEIQAAKANAPAPAPKLSKWILALNAEKAANASGTA